MPNRSKRKQSRRGTTAVEVAVILPVFFVFLWGVFEIAHAIMIGNLIRGACRDAARYGTVQEVTTSQVEQALRDYLDGAINTSHVTISVKDASVFDTGGSVPETGSEWDALPNIELADAETRQLFSVRATIPFNSIAFLPLDFTDSIFFDAHAVMRHE